VKVSMDGKGRCLDNVFVERLWRTVKYEDIYLRGYEEFSITPLGYALGTGISSARQESWHAAWESFLLCH